MAISERLDFATLLATSVHDMKNNVGLMIHQLAQLSEELGERSEFDAIGLQASQLNQSLIQLLAIYKLEKNLYASSADDVFLDEFCEDFDVAHEAMLGALDIDLNIQLEDADLEWSFDRLLMQSVLATLLCNVLQLKQQSDKPISSVCLDISTQEIEQVTYLKVSLDDNGPGFDSEQWGRFMPQQKAVEFSTGSCGLGLYFSHLVALHHHVGSHQGFLQLGESESLGGASVSFYLP